MARFAREDNVTISHSCLSTCLYTRDDKPGKFFCFAHGEQKVRVKIITKWSNWEI